MMNFLTTHWVSILVVVVFIAVIVILAVRGKKQIIYKMLYALVTEAEERYGSGEGSIKFAEVMTKIYDKLPLIIKVFITYEKLTDWIEKALVEAKHDWKKKAQITEIADHNDN